jgi:hypothetical protein
MLAMLDEWQEEESAPSGSAGKRVAGEERREKNEDQLKAPSRSG